MEFPLYYVLAERVNKRLQDNSSEPPMSLDKLKECIDTMKVEQLEHLSVLFLHWYYLSFGNLKVFSTENCDPKIKKNILPYGIKMQPGRRGFTMELNTLPINFQLLLMEYCLYKPQSVSL